MNLETISRNLGIFKLSNLRALGIPNSRILKIPEIFVASLRTVKDFFVESLRSFANRHGQIREENGKNDEIATMSRGGSVDRKRAEFRAGTAWRKGGGAGRKRVGTN